MTDKECNTPAEIPRVRLWGRPVKPMAIGILMALSAVSINGWVGIAKPAGYDRVLAVVAGITLALMLCSWCSRSQKIFEWSLLFTAGIFTARAAGVALEVGHPAAGLLPMSVAVLAGGSYILEKADQFPYWGK
jgi:hypothetical protein